MINCLINFRPLAVTIVITIHFYQRNIWHHSTFKNLLICLYNKIFWNSFGIFLSCHKYNFIFRNFRTICLLFPHVIAFFYGLFTLLIGMRNMFCFLKGFCCWIFAFHKSQIAALHQLQLSCIRCNIIRAFTVHFL